MKGERNRRSHAAVLLGKPVKRFDRCGIAQHDRDLATTRGAGGLALRAGHWVSFHSGHRFAFAGALFLIVGALAQLFGGVVIDLLAGLFGLGLHGAQRLGAFAVGLRQIRIGAAEVFRDLLDGHIHGCLPSGPMPPMCESYRVTSNVSTTIFAAAQHGARA